MTASLVMDPNPVLLHPSDTVSDAVEKIMQRRYRSLAVVDDDRHFLGVITVNSLLYLVLPKAATIDHGLDTLPFVNISLRELRHRLGSHMQEPVTRCMKTDVVTVAPDTPLLEALLTIYHEKINLPVVDTQTGRLAGMISYYDIGEKILAA